MFMNFVLYVHIYAYCIQLRTWRALASVTFPKVNNLDYHTVLCDSYSQSNCKSFHSVVEISVLHMY